MVDPLRQLWFEFSAAIAKVMGLVLTIQVYLKSPTMSICEIVVVFLVMFACAANQNYSVLYDCLGELIIDQGQYC